MLLRARLILPVCAPPIEDGGILIEGDRIAEAGRWEDLKARAAEVTDLGECAVFPGLINAHCHLDYTGMAGMLAPPKVFPDWIKSILALKAHWSYTEYAQSWLKGAGMLLAHGVTTVVDIEAVPELIPDLWLSTPLRVLSLLEMTSVRSARNPGAVLNEALQKIEALPCDDRCSAGLSPHALYSTTPELLRLAAESSREKEVLVSSHCAESEPEFDMFMHRSGPLFDWLKNQREMSDCGGVSPVRAFERTGLLDANCLLAHVNYLAEGDLEILSAHKANVAHCPGSHQYFGHQRFPAEAMRSSQVNICLGTDSLASVRAARARPPALELFSEMQLFQREHPDFTAREILRMATCHSARAIGRGEELGALAPGFCADISAIPLGAGWEKSAPEDVVLRHSGPVRHCMISGRWVYGELA